MTVYIKLSEAHKTVLQSLRLKAIQEFHIEIPAYKLPFRVRENAEEIWEFSYDESGTSAGAVQYVVHKSKRSISKEEGLPAYVENGKLPTVLLDDALDMLENVLTKRSK